MKYKRHFILLVVLILLKIPKPVKSAKILGIFPLASKSHHSFNQPIVKGLAARGHEITVVSYFQSKNVIPNYTEILLHGSFDEGYQDWKDTVSVQVRDDFTGFFNYIKLASIADKTGCKKVLELEYIRELINTEGKPIDLIIAEVYHLQCYHLLAQKLNTPLIIVSPFTPIFGVEYFIGNPYNPALTPIPCTRLTYKMDFWQRFVNTLQYTFLYWYHNYKYNERMGDYAREVFNMELPSSEELNRRTALVFYNNHFGFISRPKTPNLIDIAGVHIEEPKALPKDVEDFIAKSAHGVILFSFGTTLKANSIPPDTLKMIIDCFSAIPQRVLWRVNELNITKVPSNVKLGTWFPQRDILEHKNVIAFISHCGALGMFEAIHTGTPIIAVPLLWEQYQNANMLVEKEVAVYVDYSTMNKNTLTAAIQEITTNSRYRENMQTLSRTFKDRPISPLDEALYWSEYVLKHKGAPHLRTQAADMPLYQYLLLDVVLFLLGIVLGLIYLLKWFFKIISFRFCRRKEKIKIR